MSRGRGEGTRRDALCCVTPRTGRGRAAARAAPRGPVKRARDGAHEPQWRPLKEEEEEEKEGSGRP